jgi:hypothetical protein
MRIMACVTRKLAAASWRSGMARRESSKISMKSNENGENNGGFFFSISIFFFFLAFFFFRNNEMA